MNAKTQKLLADAEKALRPFANAVFNDNHDMTVDMAFASYDDYVRAYFVHSKLWDAINGK